MFVKTVDGIASTTYVVHFGIYTVSSNAHPLNPSFLKEVKFGNAAYFKDVHTLNIYGVMPTKFGKYTLVNPAHPPNAAVPFTVSKLLASKFVNEEQFINAPPYTVFKFDATKFFMFVQFANAYSPTLARFLNSTFRIFFPNAVAS